MSTTNEQPRSRRKPHNHYAGYVTERRVICEHDGHLILLDRERGADIDAPGRWIILWEPWQGSQPARWADYTDEKTARRDLYAAREDEEADLWHRLIPEAFGDDSAEEQNARESESQAAREHFENPTEESHRKLAAASKATHAAQAEADRPQVQRPSLSYGQFRATETRVEDLGARGIGDDLEGISGLVYADCYWIEDTSSWPTPPPAAGSGRYYLLLERSEYRSDDLDEIRRLLYGWLVSPGVGCIDPPTVQDAKDLLLELLAAASEMRAEVLAESYDDIDVRETTDQKAERWQDTMDRARHLLED